MAEKYDDVLLPFLALMRKELHANSRKGDRPGWLRMDPNTALLEVYWHTAKLSAAVKNNDGPAIMEHAADVANMAMMVLDVCGGLVCVEANVAACACGVECQDKRDGCRYRTAGVMADGQAQQSPHAAGCDALSGGTAFQQRPVSGRLDFPTSTRHPVTGVGPRQADCAARPAQDASGTDGVAAAHDQTFSPSDADGDAP